MSYELCFFQNPKGIGPLIFSIGQMRLLPSFVPVVGINSWEKDVARGFQIYFGQVELIPQLQACTVYFSAPENESFRLAGIISHAERIFDGMRHQHAISGKVRITRNDDIGTLGQWPAKTSKRMTAHEHMVIQRRALKPGQIGGQVPGNLVVLSDHVVFSGGDNGRDKHGKVEDVEMAE